jgi:DegV family protein with EDD domain
VAIFHFTPEFNEKILINQRHIMKIGLVTDSTSDLPGDIINRHAIEVVPAILNLGETSFIDGHGMTREEFYERLPGLKNSPTTSAPSVGSFQERYEKLLTAGTDLILSIHPPGVLSGIFNSARLASEAFGERVHVLDSGQLSLGLGFQVMAAAEAIARDTVLEEILELVSSVKQKVRVMALLDTMTYLHKSGRVSWAKATMGGFLNLKPLIELRFGVVNRLGQTRTRAQGIQRLIENIRKWGPHERLAILHTNAELAARQFLEDLNINLSQPAIVVNVTTVIGTHVGPNGLGFAVVPAS